MKIDIGGVIATVALGLATPAAAQTVISFKSGVAGTSVGATYADAGVTFTNAVFTSGVGLAGSSGAIGVRATSGFQFGPDDAVAGSFTGVASSVGIRGLDVGMAGLRLEAYDVSNVLIGFRQVFGFGSGAGTFRDVTVAVAGIKSFRVFQPLTIRGNNAGGDGVVLDNFTFTAASVAAVPEPATWAMMILGFGAVGGAMRYRRRRATVVLA